VKITKKYLKKLIQEEFGDFEPDGHPLVVEANTKLHEAYLAVEELTSVIFDEGVSQEMLRGKTTVHDIDSKIKWLYEQQRSYLGVKE
jgi:hypothetical protein